MMGSLSCYIFSIVEDTFFITLLYLLFFLKMSGKSAKIYVKTIDDIGLTEEQLNALFSLFDQKTPSDFQTPCKERPMWIPSAPKHAPNPKCRILTSNGLSKDGEVLTMVVSSDPPRILSGKCRRDIESEPSHLWDRDGF